MANNGSIDEIIGQQALKQVEDLSKSLKDLEDQFVRTAKAASTMSTVNVGGGSSGGNGGGIRQTTQSLTELERATAKLIKTYNEYGQDIVKIRVLQQQQSAANKIEAKESMALAGSYNQLQAKMSELMARYKAMSAEMRSGAMGKALATEIGTINTQLKSLDAGLGNMQRNVGNYTSALSKVWSVLRQAAYIIPGLGIAGIMDIIITSVVSVTKELGIFGETTVDVKNNLDKLTDSFTQFNEETKFANIYIDRQTKLLIAQAKARGASAQEIADIEKKALEERIKVLDIEIRKQITAISNIERLLSLKQAGAVGIKESESEIQKAIDEGTKKIGELQQQRADAMIDIQVTQANADAETLKKLNKKVAGNTRIDLLKLQYEQELVEAKRQSAQLEETETQAYFRRLKIAEKYSKDKLFDAKDLNAKEKEQAASFEDQLLSLVIDGTAKRKEENKKYLQMAVNDFTLEVEEKQKANEKEKKNADERQKYIRDLLNKEIKLYQDRGKEKADELKKQQDDEKKAYENLKKDIVESISSISDTIIKSIYDRRLKAIDDLDKKITESFNNEMRFIEQSGFSQRDKERKKQALEAETEAKRKKNDRDRVTELRKQAKLQKALDTATIIANTAIAITSHMKLPPPQNLINIASDIAIGAAQLAKVVATPLPQYAKGRKGGKAEMAIVGEVGTEAIVTKDGKITFTPNKATKTFLPEGADVIPNHELIKNATLLKLSKEQNVTINKYQEALIQKFEEELTELKSIKQAILDKPVSTFNNFGGFDNYVKSNIR